MSTLGVDTWKLPKLAVTAIESYLYAWLMIKIEENSSLLNCGVLSCLLQTFHFIQLSNLMSVTECGVFSLFIYTSLPVLMGGGFFPNISLNRELF